MAIWKRDINLVILNERGQGSLSGELGIEFIGITDDQLIAKLNITDRLKQPIGIMHGGISCVLAETVGSTAANFAVDQNYCAVGLEINTNHIKMVRQGAIIATAYPYHIGKTTQVWGIRIENEEGAVVSINRLTTCTRKI